MSGTSLAVLKAFIGGANAQYRAAGLSDYQMKVGKDGSVTTPNRPDPKFKQPKATGSAASEQAQSGATAAQPSASAAPVATTPTSPAPAGSASRAGTAPKITGLQQGGADAFKMTWAPIAGARQYGIWQDGTLVGHVTDPSFAGQLAAGASGTIQVDAVLANGSRTGLTKPLRAARGADGKLTFDAGAPPAASAAAATAPAAPAG